MTAIDGHVGALLSKYDETAIEGIGLLAAHCERDRAFADAFIAEAHAMGALAGTFSRKCDPAPVFAACRQILRTVSGASQVALVRLLVSGAPFARLLKQLDRVRDDSAGAVVAGLRLMSELQRVAPHVVFRKFNKKVPLSLDVFSDRHSSYALRRVRQNRTLWLLTFVDPGSGGGSSATEIAAKAIIQHGFLTALVADTSELFASGDTDAQELVHRVIAAITNHFVLSRAIAPARKRELLAAQRNVIKMLIGGLAIPVLAAEVSTLLRTLAVEVAEPLFDYAVRRDEDDVRMPNHALFSILRKLSPRHRIADSHLTVFILHHCPELVRPYLSRAAMHLMQTDRSITEFASTVATANLLTRIFVLPLPPQIRERMVRLTPSDAAATRHFDLSPAAAADEVAPKWFHEFVHKMINKSENVLLLLIALQVTEAAVQRALELKRVIREMFQARHHSALSSPGAAEATARVQVEREQFSAQLDAHLRQRLPQREEFWHRVTQQLHPTIARDGSGRSGIKAHFVMQRLLLLMRSFTSLFGLRVSWISAVPPTTAEWRPGLSRSALFASWGPSSIASLCALLAASLGKGVSMPKLHHITLGGGGSVAATAEARQPPPLLELLLWYADARDGGGADAISQHAQLWICRLFVLVFHGVSVHCGIGVEPAEVALWLDSLPVGCAAVLMHVLNAMLQQGLSKAAERIAEQLRGAQHGVIAATISTFVERTRAKFAEKPPSDPWQRDLQEQLPALSSTLDTVVARWAKREKRFGKRFATALALEERASGDGGSGGVGGGGLTGGFSAARAEQARRFERLTAKITSMSSSAAATSASPIELLVAIRTCKTDPIALMGASADPDTEAQLRQSGFIAWRAARSSTAAAAAASAARTAQTNLADALSHSGSGGGDGSWGPSLSPWLRQEILLWHIAELIAHNVSPSRQRDPTKAAQGNNKEEDQGVEDEEESGAPPMAVTAAAEFAEFEQAQQRLARALILHVAQHAAEFTALLRSWRGRRSCASSETALLFSVALALQCLAQCRVEESTVVAAAATISAAAIAQYGGLLALRDRLLFAILAACDSIAASAGGAAGGEADADVEGDDASDDASSSSSDSNSDSSGGESTDDNACSSSASGDDPASPGERTGKRRGDNTSSARREKLSKRSARVEHPTRRGGGVRAAVPSAPRGRPIRCLPSIAATRFVTGGRTVAPGVTPEVDVLAQLGETWTNGDIGLHALRFHPALVATLVTADGGDRQAARRVGPLASRVWAAIFPDAATAAELRLCDLETQANASPDPRFLVPLVFAVAASRSAHAADGSGGGQIVPASTVNAFFPYVLRGLSSTAAVMRGLCKDTIAALYPILSPVDRSIAAFARVYLAPSVPVGDGSAAPSLLRRRRSGRARMPAAVTAFLVHAALLLREDRHPLHELAAATFTSPALLSGRHLALPMGKLLHSFPIECIAAPQMLQHHHATHGRRAVQGVDDAAFVAAIGRAPPHLALILRQLQFSCGSGGDAHALRRTGALRTLMSLVSMLPPTSALRASAFLCVDSVARSCAAAARALAPELVPWCVAHLSQVTLEPDARNATDYMVDVLALLHAVSGFYRAAAPAVCEQHVRHLELAHAAMVRLRIVSDEIPRLIAEIKQVLRCAASVAAAAAASTAARGGRSRGGGGGGGGGGLAAGSKRPRK